MSDSPEHPLTVESPGASSPLGASPPGSTLGSVPFPGGPSGQAVPNLAAMFDPSAGNWQERLRYIVETMREMSSIDDPQKMVSYYAARVARPSMMADGSVSISRRGTPPGTYKITRSHRFTESVNPWQSPEKLPLLSGGILGLLLYGDQPAVLTEFSPDLSDPAYEHLRGMRSLLAIPQYDGGIAQNMVIQLWQKPNAIDPKRVPEIVWAANLFGRATSNLVLSQKLSAAYQELDRELKVVADIQRSLLPLNLPSTDKLEWATHYQTSHNAGGDYYDFFELPDGRLGMLLADVSGHGTPAAVLMAVLHALAHQLPGSVEPASVLGYLNRELAQRYTANGMFATAFYCIFDPATGQLHYSSAGHNPPRLRVSFAGEDGPVLALDRAQGLPLGVLEDTAYEEASVTLEKGDAVVFYTDGITEAFNIRQEQFGVDRLDKIIQRCHPSAAAFLGDILKQVSLFADGVPPADDQTLLIATAR